MLLNIDAASGAAGDMLLAGLIDLGASQERVESFLSGLKVDGLSLRSREVKRGGIRARLVLIDDSESFPDDDASCSHSHHHHHARDGHVNGYGSCHAEHHLQNGHHHHHGPMRHLSDMLQILERSGLPARAADRAERAFRILAEAEGSVHGCPVDEVHFHEVGGVDTLGDILGVCYGLELLDIDQVVCGVVTTGSGTVMCAHGVLPVPAPATVEILRRYSIPSITGKVSKELLTPTGAALLAACVDSFSQDIPMTTTAIGYGAGRRDFSGQPNVIRLRLGQRAGGFVPCISNEVRQCAASVGGIPDRVWQMTASIDDMTPEQTAYLAECCMTAGALDCSLTPVLMKKGRAGVEVTVLCDIEKRDELAALLLRQSSTFGVRLQQVDRIICARESVSVQVGGYDIRVKVGCLGSDVVKCAPEYEDCRRVATETGQPIGELMRDAVSAYWQNARGM